MILPIRSCKLRCIFKTTIKSILFHGIALFFLQYLSIAKPYLPYSMMFKLPTFIILCYLFLMASCSDKGNQEMPPPELPVVDVTVKDVPIYQEYVGQTYGYYDIAIRARVEGFLLDRHFNEGTKVQKGQLLYTIESETYEANTAAKRSELVRAKTNLTKAQSDLNRIRPLAERNAVSQRDLDAAVAAFEAAKAEVNAAESALDVTKVQLSYTKVRSPIDGIIGITQAKEGDFVGREPNPVVLNTVSKIDTIVVRFAISESQYLEFKRFEEELDSISRRSREDVTKKRLELILADRSIHPYRGAVDFADRQVNPNTGTITLQASFPNPERVLRPGQFARVKAKLIDVKDAILIPQRSVRELQGQFFVMKVDEQNKVKVINVDLGKKLGNMWLVKSGLQKGDRIVLEASQNLREQTQIKPIQQEFEIII